MAKEGEHFSIRLSGFHVDLANKTIKLEAAGEPFAQLRYDLKDGSIIFESPRTLPASIREEAKEEEQHVIFTGKLKTTPKEGRRTTKGKPTAWAIFAAHDEEQEEAQVFSTSFTETARDIALRLSQEAQITVKGYPPIPATEEGKRDSLHVFAILNHPKKQRQQNK